MDLLFSGNFFSPTKGSMTLSTVMDEMVLYMQERPARDYEIIIGCDSSATEDPTFPVAIVILRKGEGGRFFLRRIHYPRKFYSRQERILEEVMLSCRLALWLREHFAMRAQQEKTPPKYQFQYIHADVGENGVTRDMIKEVVGLIRGNGFEPCIKPASFAASSVADRYS